jgi:cytochrome P450
MSEPPYTVEEVARGSNTAKSLLLSDPVAYAHGVPHDVFLRLRRETPVVWIEETPRRMRSATGATTEKGSGYWAITRHAAVVAISRHPLVFSSALRGSFLSDPKSQQDLERTRQLLINMDSPQHTIVRRIVTNSFTPWAVKQLENNIRMHAQIIVERALQREQFDAVKDMAAELPLLVLADLLGMPREDRNLMFQWSNNLVGFDDPEFGGGSVERYQNAFAEAFEYAREIADTKRKHPGDDLVSLLVRSQIDGRRLTEREFNHLWILLVVGGNESTRHLISGSLQALVEWPRERRRLIADAKLVHNAVEELLRWVSPIMQFRRTAVQDTEIDGRRIREGDKIVLYYISANRDEDVFESPNRLDLGRNPNPHLAFGIGPHFCLGAHLARLEAAALLDALRPHLARFALVGPVTRLQSNFMNGIKSMPAHFVC